MPSAQRSKAPGSACKRKSAPRKPVEQRGEAPDDADAGGSAFGVHQPTSRLVFSGLPRQRRRSSRNSGTFTLVGDVGHALQHAAASRSTAVEAPVLAPGGEHRRQRAGAEAVAVHLVPRERADRQPDVAGVERLARAAAPSAPSSALGRAHAAVDCGPRPITCGPQVASGRGSEATLGPSGRRSRCSRYPPATAQSCCCSSSGEHVRRRGWPPRGRTCPPASSGSPCTVRQRAAARGRRW